MIFLLQTISYFLHFFAYSLKVLDDDVISNHQNIKITQLCIEINKHLVLSQYNGRFHIGWSDLSILTPCLH